jgi:AraC-like DNA-binding protein
MHINSLSIRQYSQDLKQHSHSYYQLVFPLEGSLNIQSSRHLGFVDIGQCLIIKPEESHAFKAHENARFIVADMHDLPVNLIESTQAVFSISKPILGFLEFIDKQLSHQVDNAIELSCMQLFELLLEQQECLQNYDKRIERVIHYLHENLAQQHTLTLLSELACLSLTQFKKVFKDNTKMTVQAYLTYHRMHKAKSLLVHSDTPIQLVGEHVGYQNPSAFSRRFKHFFGQSPKALSRV